MTKLYSIKGLQALLICLSLLVSSSIQAQVPSYVPTDGLVGYWPFNGNANDESGNGNDGTVNGASLTEDRNGNVNAAYSFDGVDDIITLNAIPFLNGTISLWYEESVFNNSNTNGGHPPIGSQLIGQGTGQQPSVTYCDFAIGISSYNGQPEYYAFENSTINSWTDYSLGNVGNNSGWNNISVVIDGVDLSMYLNGSLFSSTTLSNELLNSGAPLSFGGRYVFQAFSGVYFHNFFNGSLDEIGFWNRALTQAEIQALYIGCNVAPTTIAGSVNPFTLTSSDYACNNNPGSTYEWTITNGVITAGQGTSNVTVLWGEEGAGTLTVVETNTEGCSGTPATIEVTIECATTATTIDGPLGPNALTETTYTCNGVATSTFEWTISNGVITSGQGTNSVTVLWAATGLGSISVQETTNANCTGDLISINVVVIPTSIDELNESNLFLYPNPAKEEITLQTNQSSIGSLYIIVDQTGKQIASGKITGTNTTIKLDQFASGMYTIIRDGKTSQQFQVIK
jgi:hypothetical protein